MGSKRPEQAKRAESATDYKTRTDDEHIHAEDKEHLESNPHDQPLIPEVDVNPALRELRERQAKGGEPDNT
jgi:hypothetical protein